MTREEWLAAAVAEVRDLFAAGGHPLPQRIRVTCGFPTSWSRTGAVSQCWQDADSADQTVEVCVAPTVAEPSNVLAALLAALCRAVPGGMSGRSITFAAAIAACEVDDKGSKTAAFDAAWGDLLAALGPYPHAELSARRPVKQSTRQIKLTCPTCGYVLRASQRWISTGLPVCHDGDTFVVESEEASHD